MHLQMEKYMHKNLIDAGVNFPVWWNEALVLEAISTLDTLDLYEYFNKPNATSFTRFMKPYFPNRPSNMPYSRYVRNLLANGDALTRSFGAACLYYTPNRGPSQD
jgi:hypothetical protein